MLKGGWERCCSTVTSSASGVNGCAGMAQVFAAIEAEQAGPQSVPTKNAA